MKEKEYSIWVRFERQPGKNLKNAEKRLKAKLESNPFPMRFALLTKLTRDFYPLEK